MVGLFVVEPEGVLGSFTDPDPVALLRELSPCSDDEIRQECRRVLLRAEALHRDRVLDLCGALLIDPDRWPSSWPVGDFEIEPGAREALGRLRALAPIEILTNIPVTTGAARIAAAMQACEPYVTRAHASYQRGICKPNPRLWRMIALERDIAVESIVHIGSDWTEDVLGPLLAGCRAIFVNSRGAAVPPEGEWPAGADRMGVVSTVGEISGLLTQWDLRP